MTYVSAALTSYLSAQFLQHSSVGEGGNELLVGEPSELRRADTVAAVELHDGAGAVHLSRGGDVVPAGGEGDLGDAIVRRSARMAVCGPPAVAGHSPGMVSARWIWRYSLNPGAGEMILE